MITENYDQGARRRRGFRRQIRWVSHLLRRAKTQYNTLNLTADTRALDTFLV